MYAGAFLPRSAYAARFASVTPASNGRCAPRPITGPFFARLIATFAPRSCVAIFVVVFPASRSAARTPSAGVSQTAQIALIFGFLVRIAVAAFCASPAKSGPEIPCSSTILMPGNFLVIVSLNPFYRCFVTQKSAAW